MSAARTCCRDGTFCTLCCFTHGVPEIDKHPFAPCRHCVEGRGCAAHLLPPDACCAFRCAYLKGLTEDDTWPHACGFVQEYRWTRYGYTWIVAATGAAELATSLARREIIRALERGLVVVLEKPGGAVVSCADNCAASAAAPRGQPQPTNLTCASAYLGVSVSAKPYVPADLGALGWHQL